MALSFIEILKVVFLGIVEGVTEWLPISSTGHMLLVDEFISLNASTDFKEMFFVVIQLGAILAVVTIFWNKMWPFQLKDKTQPVMKKDTWSMWFKTVVACIPGAIVTILFDNYIEAHLHTAVVIAIALIFYGIAFIVIENYHKGKKAKVTALDGIDYKLAFWIGMFQLIAAIFPGTSRSGATIVGALLLGVSRTVAAEYTFFLAIPVMFGASLLKGVKFLAGASMTSMEGAILAVGMVVAFVVSFFVIKFLLGYVKKHDFKVFGYYRIALGIIVILFFLIRG